MFRLLIIPSIPEGKLPLHIACQEGNRVVVGRLLGLGADPSKCDPSRRNAVHYAAMSQSPSVVVVRTYRMSTVWLFFTNFTIFFY